MSRNSERPLPEDPKTREAAKRHRAHPEPTVQGQVTGRQLQDTDGEGGVGGSTDGLYLRQPSGTGPDNPRHDAEEVGQLDYERAHAELGDGSEDFTSERAEAVRETELGEPEVTESLTSSGVMEEDVDVGHDAVGPDQPAPRREPEENRKDPRKPPDSAIQNP